MIAKEIMTTDVITAFPEDTVKGLVQRMLEKDVTALPVIDRQGNIKGIVTEGDIIVRIDISPEPIDIGIASLSKLKKMFKILDKKSGATAAEIMTTDLITVEEDTPLTEISRLMVKHRIKNVLVVRGQKLVGLVGRKNILRLVLSKEKE